MIKKMKRDLNQLLNQHLNQPRNWHKASTHFDSNGVSFEMKKSIHVLLCSFLVLIAVTGCVKLSTDKSQNGGDDDQGMFHSDGLPQPDIEIPIVANKMIYRSVIPTNQSDAMNESISSLYVNSPSNSSDDAYRLRTIMQVSSLDPAVLQLWLEARVKYVVDSDFQLKYPYISKSSRSFNYPQPYQVPPEWTALTQGGNVDRPLLNSARLASGSSTSTHAQVVMSNIGTSLYLLGKTATNPTLIQVNFDRGNPVPLTSPRTGLLQIGPGLFHDFGTKIQNVALDIFRVSTLFHEARHSDGNGETLGFLHSRCPESHDLHGKYACDSAANGAYTVGASLMKTMMQSCVGCTSLSKHFLETIYFDVSQRVIVDASDSPYSDSQTPVGKDWDAQPEGQRSN